MVQAVTKNLTLAEFLQLAETKPASEYLDGKIIQNPCHRGNTVQFKVNLYRLLML